MCRGFHAAAHQWVNREDRMTLNILRSPKSCYYNTLETIAIMFIVAQNFVVSDAKEEERSLSRQLFWILKQFAILITVYQESGKFKGCHLCH